MKKSIIYILLSLHIVFGCSSGTGRIILIPVGYEGIVTIIYDVKDGTAKEFENGKQVFKIPLSGVLNTQHSLDTTWVSSDEINYYYYSGNKRTEIARGDFPKDLPTDSLQIIGERVGVTSEIPNTVFTFLVCTYDKSDSLAILRENLSFAKLKK